MPRLARLALVLLLALGLLAARRLSGEEARSVAQAALVLAQARDPAARAGAALVLGGVKESAQQPSARAALVTALSDPQASVRRHVAVALTNLSAPSLRVPLEAALTREADAEVLPALLLALGALHEPELVPRLAAYRAHASPNVRAAAVTAVSDAGGEAARAVLLEVLTEPGGTDLAWHVRAAAILGLSRVGRLGDAPAVLAALEAPGGWASWLARSALAAALPRIEAAPLPRLEQLVADPDERVAVTAAESLWRVGGEPALLALLEHPGASVRAAAAGACARRSVVAARSRLVAIAYRDADGRTRWSASLALFRLGFSEGDELLLWGVKSGEPAVWAEALVVLEEHTGASHGNDIAAWRRELVRLRQGGRRAGR